VIIFDTNALSELLNAQPDPRALATIRPMLPTGALTAITMAEIAHGAKKLPRSRKRTLVENQLAWLRESFGPKIFSFSADEADAYASVVVTRSRSGRPITEPDAMIAAICLTHDAALVTRNVRDFEGVGLELINPWDPVATVERH
jgi:predicted nucleic acid-binding protein